MSRKINDLGYKTNKAISLINESEFFMNLENRKANRKKKKLNREYYEKDSALFGISEKIMEELLKEYEK